MQKFCIWKLDTKYLKLTHLAKMQKFCIWETGNKIPKIDRVKVRCKNSASGKLDTKYLKSTAWLRCKNSASGKLNTKYLNWLHQATVSVKIVGTLLCLLLPPMLVYMIWWLNRNKQHWEGKGKHKKGKKKQCLLSVSLPQLYFWLVWGL